MDTTETNTSLKGRYLKALKDNPMCISIKTGEFLIITDDKGNLGKKIKVHYSTDYGTGYSLKKDCWELMPVGFDPNASTKLDDELIVGDYYKVTESTFWMIGKVIVGNNGSNTFNARRGDATFITSDETFFTNISWCYKDTKRTYQKATAEEIAWLDECIKQNKYVDRDKIPTNNTVNNKIMTINEAYGELVKRGFKKGCIYNPVKGVGYSEDPNVTADYDLTKHEYYGYIDCGLGVVWHRYKPNEFAELISTPDNHVDKFKQKSVDLIFYHDKYIDCKNFTEEQFNKLKQKLVDLGFKPLEYFDKGFEHSTINIGFSYIRFDGNVLNNGCRLDNNTKYNHKALTLKDFGIEESIVLRDDKLRPLKEFKVGEWWLNPSYHEKLANGKLAKYFRIGSVERCKDSYGYWYTKFKFDQAADEDFTVFDVSYSQSNTNFEAIMTKVDFDQLKAQHVGFKNTVEPHIINTADEKSIVIPQSGNYSYEVWNFNYPVTPEEAFKTQSNSKLLSNKVNNVQSITTNLKQTNKSKLIF